MNRKLAVSLAAAIAAVNLCALSSPAWATYRDGWCREGEGQTVVVDWTPVGGSGSEATTLVRCIALVEGGGYPVDEGDWRTSPLSSAGIPWDATGSLVVTINGITAHLPEYWHYSAGKVENGKGAWGNASTDPVVNSYVGNR